MKGVPGFIFGGEGRGRVISKPQSTQTSENDQSGVRPGRFPPRANDLGAMYAEKLLAARAVRSKTLLDLIDSTAMLGYSAETVLVRMGPILDLFPVHRGGVVYGLRFEVRSSRGNSGRLNIYLRAAGPEGESVTLLSGATSSEIRARMTPVVGRARTTEFIGRMGDLQAVVEQVVRCRVLSAAFRLPPEAGNGPLLNRWVMATREFGLACARDLADRVQKFDSLDAELNQLVFEFNATIENVRYRSLICSADVSPTDPLGPREPSFRVVTHISRKTGRRYSTKVSDYKAQLQRRQLREQLSKRLGREPSDGEFAEALAAVRKRTCSTWITRGLIEHCRLGRHSSGILGIQQRIAGVMEQWCEMRQLFQALLGEKGKR